MLSNFHTHTTFCDGKNTPEEVVLAAIDKGFGAIGFSGHGPTVTDSRYCMHDTVPYIAEITRLKEKYRDRIQVYLGIEEEMISLVDRSKFEYLIGSSHYCCVDGTYYSIDGSPAHFEKCLAAFGGDAMAMAEQYYTNFVAYIRQRKPDIIGHFDLITKFDEMGEPLFLGNPVYEGIARDALLEAAKSECIFEVNTGAISRGYRSAPYPSEPLLHLLKKEDAKLILSSDSHQIETLDTAFAQTKQFLYDIGFRKLYTLYDGEFTAYSI